MGVDEETTPNHQAELEEPCRRGREKMVRVKGVEDTRKKGSFIRFIPTESVKQGS